MPTNYSQAPRDPREPLLCLPDGSTDGAHPLSPAGSGGPGRFTSRLPAGKSAVVAYHRAPGVLTTKEPGWFDEWWSEIRYFGTWAKSEVVELKDKVVNIYDAYERAKEKYVNAAIEAEIGQGIQEVIDSLIPGLLLMLAVLVAGALFGGAAGAILGSLAGGVGALPGGAAGATIGLEMAGLVLEWMGLLFLANYLKEHIVEALGIMRGAVDRAWNAGARGNIRERNVDLAAQEMARAIAVFLRIVVEGVVMALLAKSAVKGTKNVGARLGALGEDISKSRLGPGFARWVDTNYEWAVKKFGPKPKGTASSAGGVGGTPSAKVPPEKPLASEPAKPKLANGAARNVKVSKKQVQKKFKHAKDFGVDGNYSPAKAEQFQKAIENHVANPETKVIKGTYRGQPVTHYVNPKTGLNVVQDASGEFQTGWKLSPAQQNHVLTTGNLGGG